jgi:hypothetical protein
MVIVGLLCNLIEYVNIVLLMMALYEPKRVL